MSSADVAFLHGFNESAAEWDKVIAALGTGLTPHAVDLPGHGTRVAPPASYSPSVVSDMVRGSLAETGARPRICVAHSAAASLAVDLARHDPDIEALVLVSPSIEGYPFDGDFGFRLRLLRQAAAAADPNTRFVRQWQLMHGLLAGMAADGSAAGLADLLEAVGGSITFPPTTQFAWDHVDEIDAAVTVLVAEDDFPVYRAHHDALRARRPAWRWVVLDTGGHDLPRTRTDVVAGAVAAAVQGIRSSRPLALRNST